MCYRDHPGLVKTYTDHQLLTKEGLNRDTAGVAYMIKKAHVDYDICDMSKLARGLTLPSIPKNWNLHNR